MCLGSVHCLCHPSCLGLCRDLSVGTCSVAKGSATSQSSEPQTHHVPEVAHGVFGGFGREEPTRFLPLLLKTQTCFFSWFFRDSSEEKVKL